MIFTQKSKELDAILQKLQNKEIDRDSALEQIEKLTTFGFNVQTQVDKLTQKFQTQLSARFGHVSFSLQGFHPSLSVFRNFSVEENSIVELNTCAGSHFQDSTFTYHSVVSKNSFYGVNIQELELNRAELTQTKFALSKVHKLEIEGSGVHQNQIQKSNLQSFVLVDSLLKNSKIVGSTISHTHFKNSRLNNLSLSDSFLVHCEMIESNLENLEFSNCKFEQCVFKNIKIKNKKQGASAHIQIEKFKIDGICAVNLNLSGEYTPQEFLKALKQTVVNSETAEKVLKPENLEKKNIDLEKLKKTDEQSPQEEDLKLKNSEILESSLEKQKKVSKPRPKKTSKLEISSDIS
jgi:uncharacterized protein YjbI with pentapeptide repeats